jgi:hypothetical protein
VNFLKRLLGGQRWQPQDGATVVMPAIGPVTLRGQLGPVWSLVYSRGDELRVLYRNTEALAREARPVADRARAQAVLDATQPTADPLDREVVVARLDVHVTAQPPPPASAKVLQLAYGGLRAQQQGDRVLLKRVENPVVGELAVALERTLVDLADELRARFGWASRQDSTVEDVWVPDPPEPDGEEVPLGFFEVGERLVLCDPGAVDRLAEDHAVATCLAIPVVAGRWKGTAKGGTRLESCRGLFLINADYAAEEAVGDPPRPEDVGRLGIDSGAVVVIDHGCRFDDEFVARVLQPVPRESVNLGGHGLYVPGPGDGVWDVRAVFDENRQAVAVVVQWG